MAVAAKNFMAVGAIYLSVMLMQPVPAPAEQTTGEKVEDTARDAGNSVKKGVRNVKDKTCEMVNGKMKCAAKKAKHGVNNAADSVEAKAKELGDKAD